jgi:hypothetical protein
VCFVPGLADSDCELIGAGGRIASARIAFQVSFDLIHGHTFNELGNCFEVSVAPTGKTDIGDDVAIKMKIDLHGADISGSVRIIHYSASN